MIEEKDIMHERGRFFVLRKKDRYTVIEMLLTHGMSDSAYEKTEDGLSIAIARCNYLDKADKAKGEK